MTWDAFLFDMDGTILTSIPAVERAWTAWAARNSAPLAQILHYLHGRPAVDTISRFAPAGTDIAAEVAWLEATEIADTDGILPIPGAAAFLGALPPSRWAVVTSASRALALRRIAAAGLPLPPLLVTADDVTRGKPDPQGYLLAAQRLGAQPGRCLVFEDTATGLKAGLAAGAQVVRVLGTPGAEAVDASMTIADYRGLGVATGPQGLSLVRQP